MGVVITYPLRHTVSMQTKVMQYHSTHSLAYSAIRGWEKQPFQFLLHNMQEYCSTKFCHDMYIVIGQQY